MYHDDSSMIMNTVPIYSTWLNAISTSLQYEPPKILHPEFSFITQAQILFILSAFVTMLLVLQRVIPSWFSLVGSYTKTLQTVHAWYSILIWLMMVLDGRSQERNTIIFLGISTFHLFLNRSLAHSCEVLQEARVKADFYRKAMDDAVALYQVNEAHCREVVSDGKTLRALLTLVKTELDAKGVNDQEQRIEKGAHLFNDLLSRERFHNNLVNAPHIRESLGNWLNYRAMDND